VPAARPEATVNVSVGGDCDARLVNVPVRMTDTCGWLKVIPPTTTVFALLIRIADAALLAPNVKPVPLMYNGAVDPDTTCVGSIVMAGVPRTVIVVDFVLPSASVTVISKPPTGVEAFTITAACPATLSLPNTLPKASVGTVVVLAFAFAGVNQVC